MSDHLLYTARRALVDPPPTRRRHPTATPDPDQPLPAARATPGTPPLPLEKGERDISRVPLRYHRTVIASTTRAAAPPPGRLPARSR